MERVLYVVFRERPLLVGYLMAMLGTRSSDGRRVEIKLDQRRSERRRSGAARDPDRRSGERRLQPSLDPDLRSRGYAAVFQSGANLSGAAAPTPAPAEGWRPQSTWRPRTGRAKRRNRMWWGSLIVLLVAIGVAVIVARSIR